VFVTERPVTELAVSWFATVKLQLKGTPATWALAGQVLVTPMPARAETPEAAEMRGVRPTEGSAGTGPLSCRPQLGEANATLSNTAERTE
jgi:hypothetical protein